MKPRTTRLLRILGTALLVLGALGAALVIPRLPAVRCLLGFQAGVPDDLEDFRAVPEGMQLLEDRDRYGFDRVWLLRAGSGRAPTVVFVHGVAPEGIRDGRILHALRAFHAAGCTVVAPELPTLVDPLSRETPGAGLPVLLGALAAGRIEGAHPTRAGVVGISVGGAVALRGCARAKAAGHPGVRALLLIGAPDDLRRPAVWWFEAEDPAKESDGSLLWERRNAAAFARSFLLRAGLRKRFDDGEVPASLAAWLAEDPLPPEPYPPDEHPIANTVAAWVHAPPEVRAAERERILTDAAERIESLSPALWDAELRYLRGTAVFLLHGHGDPLVPLSEAQPLATRLRAHTIVDVLESHMVGHTSVNEVGFGEQLAHVIQMDDFLTMIGR